MAKDEPSVDDFMRFLGRDRSKKRYGKIRIGECPICKKDVCLIRYDANGREILNDCKCQEKK